MESKSLLTNIPAFGKFEFLSLKIIIWLEFKNNLSDIFPLDFDNERSEMEAQLFQKLSKYTKNQLSTPSITSKKKMHAQPFIELIINKFVVSRTICLHK